MVFVALGIVVVLLLVVVLVVAVKVVKPDTVAVVERAGRFQRLAQPGVVVLMPFVDRIRAHVTNEPQVLIMPSRPLATADGGWVMAPTTVRFSVVDPVRATYEIASPALALEQLVMTGLRQVVRALTTYAALIGRAEIERRMAAVLADPASKWGLRIDDIELGEVDRAEAPLAPDA
jgi:regulator of protease activity HflC (stomatin/prohibitin superfamily)